ncbi:protein Shroom2 isoform X2 [Cyclopterus lumpus]|uniref:protein Shroom2 isoform X2 n=1 Tax=Cyclopterus lumpus TaxID=8103 RepID=UPI0014868DC4|nr:protein Shroom2 isoform X2 [Cyclopterus lumpus]
MVEEGSKAASVSLQVGDELVNINEIPLSGFRQEAICLVKGSHKTLSLVVKRRNEPISRPHSWHATKFNEGQSETAKTQSPPTQVWHARYDASSSSTDLSSGWEQTDLRRVSDQFSSLGSMDSLEHASHPYPAGQLSPAKSNNSMEHLGGGKRDSAYSSFSTSSGTPDYTLSKNNAASTENMLCKVGQWDAAGKHNNARNSQGAIEGVKQDDRVAYFQMPGVNSGCAGPPADDSAGSRHSTSSRTGLGPVWHVPEAKKKTASPSPPPPPPPARSDSFAATKVHERGLVIAHPEGPESHVAGKTASETRRSHNPPLKSDGDVSHTSSDKSNQLASNKQPSPSGSDVWQNQPSHQRHHSDKSTFYSQPRTMSVPKPQNVGGYYCSMQELPTNGSAQHFGQNHRRNLSSSLSTTAADQSTDSSRHSRYYCVTTVQPTSGKPEDRKSVAGSDLAQPGNERNSLSPQTVTTVKYHLPQQQQHSSLGKDSNGYGKHQVTTVIETSGPKSSSDDRGGQRGHGAEAQFTSHAASRPPEQRRSLPPQHHQDVRHHGQASNQICPQATPMLHFLSMDDVAGQDEATRGPNAAESLDSKMARRSDRFATTLRNEIQMRRAKLQKSTSAAALPGTEGQTGDDPDVWKSTESPTTPSADGSFTSSYKDNLKEAQARVLKATSFRRKDLEPVLLEHPAAEALPNYPSSALARKDVAPLPTVSESVMSKSGQVTRIGGRKRFSADKKVRSFSEPGKIHEVGVKEDLHRNESSSLDHQKLRKESGKPAFLNHLPPRRSAETKTRGLASASETEDTMRPAEEVQEGPHSAHKQVVLDQQRLGTFAEYEARWNIQKPPPETRAPGRYRSADNILDPGPEERTKPTCFHERSRSSPSTDIYGQKIPVPARENETEYSPTETKPAEPPVAATGFLDDCKERETHCDPDLAPGPGPAQTRGPASVSRGLAEVAPPPPPECPEVDSLESLSGPHADPDPMGDSEPSRGQEDQGEAGPLPPPHRPPVTVEVRRSPSPQFSPQRLSDKPPVSLQDSNRAEHVIENQHPAVKKVPIRIVHSEGVSEQGACPYLQQADAPAAQAEGPGVIRLGGPVGAAVPDSDFCAFARQTDAYMTTVGGHTETPCEDQKREELARSIMGKDKSLADILDQSKMKTTMDLMQGIFPQGEQLLEGAHQHRKVSRPAEEREKEDSMAAAVALVTSSTYYSTSAPKAELLIKMKDMQEQQEEEEEEEEEEEDELDIDLAYKKQQLIDSLSKKLQVLREARESLQEDVLDNNALGDEVEARVQQVCKPNELDKFRMFVGDLDKVVSLLLSLSGRLARVENALNVEEDVTAEERRTLMEKRKLLIRQHEDAKELKENLDRRERLVSDILAHHLPADSLTDYEHFVKMKSALIIEQRKLEDKIKLGEEQLKCLTDSLPMEQRLAL